MSKWTRTFPFFLVCACLTLLVYAQDIQTADGLQGKLVRGGVYVNAALGMTITLSGVWEQGEAVQKRSKPPLGCGGPLCGNPEINVALRTKADVPPPAWVRLAGYKLPAQYLDRSRYPLSGFAGVMMEGSMRSGSGLVPIGARSAIRLDGNAAYRQAAGMPGETAPKIIGYVSEANGYVFLLVISVPDSRLQAVQSAIEAMKLGSKRESAGKP